MQVLSIGLQKKWRQIALSLGLIFIASGAISTDPVSGRAAVMKQISKKDIARQSLRFKIIRSRALLLYLQDILPQKGSPYAHLAHFAAEVTLPAFNSAQHTGSAFMDNKAKPAWLPIQEEKTLTTADMKKHSIRAVTEYFVKYVATFEIIKNILLPSLKSSIIVSSIKESSGPEVEAEFQKAWSFISYMSDQYSEIFAKQPILQEQLKLQRKQMLLSLVASIAQGMKNQIDKLEAENNPQDLRPFLTTIENIGAMKLKLSAVPQVKTQITQLTSDTSAQFKRVKAALETVDLPDSGDIDGAQESFEVAMRLEVGFDLLKKLFQTIKQTW